MAEADFALGADCFVAAFAAHGDARRVTGPDSGEDDVVAQPAGFVKQSPHKRRAEAAPLGLGIKVQGRLSSVGVNGGVEPLGQRSIAEKKLAVVGD